MRRVLFRVGSLDFYSYPVMLYCGLVAGIYAGYGASSAVGIPGGRFVAAVLVLELPALVGSRIATVVGHWDTYKAHPQLIMRRSNGGMAMYGGFLLAVAVSVPLLRALGVGFVRFWDAATITLLVGMIFTRFGCLLNGCCAGRLARGRVGVNLADRNGIWQRRQPTQLFEAGLAALLLIGALGLLLSYRFPGVVFLFAVGGYGAGRFLLDPLRAQRTRAKWSVSPRLVSAGLVAVSLPILVVELL